MSESNYEFNMPYEKVQEIIRGVQDIFEEYTPGNYKTSVILDEDEGISIKFHTENKLDINSDLVNRINVFMANAQRNSN